MSKNATMSYLPDIGTGTTVEAQHITCYESLAMACDFILPAENPFLPKSVNFNNSVYKLTVYKWTSVWSHWINVCVSLKGNVSLSKIWLLLL